MNSAVATVIPGAKNVRQVEMNIAADEVRHAQSASDLIAKRLARDHVRKRLLVEVSGGKIRRERFRGTLSAIVPRYRRIRQSGGAGWRFSSAN